VTPTAGKRSGQLAGSLLSKHQHNSRMARDAARVEAPVALAVRIPAATDLLLCW